jgi:hypothetical protein
VALAQDDAGVQVSREHVTPRIVSGFVAQHEGSETAAIGEGVDARPVGNVAVVVEGWQG